MNNPQPTPKKPEPTLNFAEASLELSAPAPTENTTAAMKARKANEKLYA